MVNCIPRNQIVWNLNKDIQLSYQENAFENIICDVAAILFKPRYVMIS